MRLFELTFSPTGGTQKAADLLAAAWNVPAKIVNLLKPTFAEHLPHLEQTDLCLVAMPVYGGRIPAVAAQRLQQIQGNGALAVPVAVYGNRAVDDALVEMEDLLTANGFRILAGVEAVAEHSLTREIAAGRPDTKDAAELLTFGQKIQEKAQRETWEQPMLPGNRPYREFGGGAKPTADDRCTGCGTCVRECPVGAIPADDPKTVNAALCASCMRCISVCPTGARHNDPNVLAAIGQKLRAVCPERNENRLYL